MEIIVFKEIDWDAVCKKLQHLRKHNENLRRYCCYFSRNNNTCDGENCMNCSFNMDEISQKELSEVIGVELAKVQNWENCRTIPPLDYLLYYAEMCQLPLEELLVFKK